MRSCGTFRNLARSGATACYIWEGCGTGELKQHEACGEPGGMEGPDHGLSSQRSHGTSLVRKERLEQIDLLSMGAGDIWADGLGRKSGI